MTASCSAGYQPPRDQYAGLPTVSLLVVSDLVSLADLPLLCEHMDAWRRL